MGLTARKLFERANSFITRRLRIAPPEIQFIPKFFHIITALKLDLLMLKLTRPYWLYIANGLFWFATAKAQTPVHTFNYEVQKKVVCREGAVVSAHPLASEAGISVMKRGGNAIDGAIATQLALAVVYPAAGNIGGGGFMVGWLKGNKKIAIDFREKAPGKAFKEMYLDSNGNAQMKMSQDGHLASGVPGSVAGIFTALKYAKLPFNILIQPAIDLAEHGFVINEEEARDLNYTQSSFRKYNTIMPVFVKSLPWKVGDTLIQKDLANTLKRIQQQGAKGFYEGETARLIVEEMKRGKGIISYDDLKQYHAVEREPVVFNYKNDYTIITMPLPSSGGVLLPQMMRMIEDQPLKSYGYGSLKSVHLMTEVERLAYADRAMFLGDRDFYKVPVRKLTSYEYAKERMKLYNPDTAGNSRNIQAGIIPAAESEETTHFDVYDKEGNSISVTTTLNGGYGSRTVVGGAGFLLNNEMDDFSVKPGVPDVRCSWRRGKRYCTWQKDAQFHDTQYCVKEWCTLPDRWNTWRYDDHDLGFSNHCRRVGIRHEHGRCRI